MRGPTRALGVILMGHRGPEERGESGTREVHGGTVETGHHRAGRLEEAIGEAMQHLDVDTSGRRPHVDEQHRHLLAFALARFVRHAHRTWLEVAVTDHRDESIPAPVDRLDELRRVCVVAERRAQLAHARLQHRFDDVRIGPHGIEQLVFGHQPARMRNQVAKQREILRGELQTPRAVPQRLVGLVQTIPPEEELPPHGASVLPHSCGVRHIARGRRAARCAVVRLVTRRTVLGFAE
jgi:hypothetical protein